MLRWVARSVRRKLGLVVLVTTLVALVLAGAAMVIYDQSTYRRSWVNDLTTQADILGRASAPALSFDDPKSANENLALLATRPKVSAAAIYNARGKLFAVYRRADALNREFPKLPEADGSIVNSAELQLFKRVVDNNEILGTVYLRADSELSARLKDYLGILAAASGLSLLLAFVMSVWLQAALTKPILAVTEVAREVIDRRDFSLRVRKSTDDEIGVLVEAFNGMLAEVGRRAEALEDANRALEREIAARQHKDDELRELNADLERRVASRTKELEAANKDLEGFSYSVSHDLRAPLRGIMGFADAVMEDHAAELSDEAKRRLGIVKSEARRMGDLIDDLLAFSRLGRQALQMTSLDMTRLAQTAFEGLRAQHDGEGVDLQLGPLPGARGDRVLLGQVWMNLLSNALKYSSKRDKPRIDVSAITDEKEHVYFVRDNGAGFDPRYQSKLFGVFQRLHDSTDFPGTGVGLALVQRIVVRHGGRVWAEGRPNEGATFYFTLPKEQS